ncbi:hypothetical protein BDR04DRAFT_1107905 [Suillus decipiens]|nr:hypothetical protein BDR04DRAFT_1107905 [Suillus decipiens]
MSTVRPHGHAQPFGQRSFVISLSITTSKDRRCQSSRFMGTRSEGDILQVSGCSTRSTIAGYLFMVPKDEGCPKPLITGACPTSVAAVKSRSDKPRFHFQRISQTRLE